MGARGAQASSGSGGRARAVAAARGAAGGTHHRSLDSRHHQRCVRVCAVHPPHTRPAPRCGGRGGVPTGRPGRSGAARIRLLGRGPGGRPDAGPAAAGTQLAHSLHTACTQLAQSLHTACRAATAASFTLPTSSRPLSAQPCLQLSTAGSFSCTDRCSAAVTVTPGLRPQRQEICFTASREGQWDALHLQVRLSRHP